MITTADLKTHTKADLTRLAKRLGVTGCSSMLKDDLVKAVAKAQRSKANGSSKSKVSGKSNGKAAKTSTTRSKTSRLTAAKPADKPAKKQLRKDAPKKAVAAKPKKVVAKKAKLKPKSKPTNPRVLKRIRELQLQNESTKDVSSQPTQVQPPGSNEAIWEREPADNLRR